MGKPAVSLRNKLIALCAAGLIACGFAPFALADDAQEDPVGASFVLAQSEGSGEAATPNSILASTLTSDGVSIVSADVMLNDDSAAPVIGSFTVNGLTFAVTDDGGVTLVSVGASFVLAQSEKSDEVATPNSVILSDGEAGVEGSLNIPSDIVYNDVTYDVTAIGPYAFYLSGSTQVDLPASIVSVDDRAFRSSDVVWVDVDADNPNIASFDGALYDASLTSLLLIPEGRAGAVLLPCETEVITPSLFSHCSLVTSISVEEGGAAFASWDGLLYDASGTTLLRVPAGATEITIREGCTTIAAGAMEGCAKLERINAPATVTSISPNVFESVPTVLLPASAILSDDAEASTDVILSVGEERSDEAAVEESPAQLTALVALATTDDDASKVNASEMKVTIPDESNIERWEEAGFVNTVIDAGQQEAETSLQTSSAYGAAGTAYLDLGTNTMTNLIWSISQNKWLSRSPSTITGRYAVKWDISATIMGWVIEYKTASEFLRHDGPKRTGYTFSHFVYNGTPVTGTQAMINGATYTLAWTPNTYTVTLDGQGGTSSSVVATYDANMPPIDKPVRQNYIFLGYFTLPDGQGTCYYDANANSVREWQTASNATLYASWRLADFDVSFDTSSEPSDEDYPGIEKPDEVINITDGQVEIEDPKRPGYVFQGWVLPDASTGNKEALDQDLVYQGDDGKWYMDASKLPDYAIDGKVELTARWTSIISVDVPSAVTFYADTVTQGQESREGAASSAFGQSTVVNQSQVDLRVVGLESVAVESTDTMLGADSILKKAAAATPATSASKLLSLYPSAKAWTAEELQDPDAVGGTKATSAVDFDLDDLLLEASFDEEDFTIPAGGTLNMGYRLNLTETGQELDYDKLSTLEDGQSAAIANVSYCFGVPGYRINPTGSKDDPLYIELSQEDSDALGNRYAAPGVYGFIDILNASADLSEHAANPSDSLYHRLFKMFLDKQVLKADGPGEGPYFKLDISGTYWDLQLIGICQDVRSDGSGKAGLTFQMRDSFACNGAVRFPGAGSYETFINPGPTNSNAGGWKATAQRELLRTLFASCLRADLAAAIVPVTKHQQLYGGVTSAYLQRTNNETIWLPSMFEVFGTTFANYNEAEGLTNVSGYEPFQYQAFKQGSSIRREYSSSGASGVCGWWLRTAYRGNATHWCNVSIQGMQGLYYTQYEAFSVCPAFCL